jgi:hypothetical protein
MEYLLGALVVVAVLAFVVLPLVRGERGAVSTTATPGPAEERAAIYRELVELELDQRIGKVSEADFREQADALLARAAVLISDEDAERAAADDAVEREIAAMRQNLHRTPTPAAEETRT